MEYLEKRGFQSRNINEGVWMWLCGGLISNRTLGFFFLVHRSGGVVFWVLYLFFFQQGFISGSRFVR